MKKSFLNLRKLGLVVVAASTMAMYSCGGEEHTEEDATEAVENAVEEVEVASETEDMKCEAGKCEGQDATEESCGDGKCDGGDSTEVEGEAKCDGGEAAE